MNNWRYIKFVDFIKLQRGFDLPNNSRKDGVYPVIASTSINGYHSSFKVKGPCVTTGRSGALGKVLYIKEDCWPLNTTLWVKDFKGNNPKFVYFKLKTLDLARFNSGAGVPTLNRNHIDELSIYIPNITTQNQIVSILNNYDDLIENNEKRIKILEEMAQRLYTEWFVKFKFPGCEKIKMVDSGTEFGMIPEGWKVEVIENLLEKIKRKPKIKTDKYKDNGIYPIVDQGKSFISGYTDDLTTIYDKDIVVFGDHTRCFKYCNFKFACGADGTQLIKSKNQLRMPQTLFYYSLINSGLQNYHYARHFKFLKALKVLIPDQENALMFDLKIGTFMGLIKKLNEQNLNLSRIRDLLVPQLVTGKMEVKN